MKDHTSRKYYIILAIKDKPFDVLGMCEHSFCMDWHRDRVMVWDANEGDYDGKPAREHFKEMVNSLKKNEDYGDNWRTLRRMKGRMTAIRKQYSNHASKDFCPYGRSTAEYKWNWMKHYAMWCGKHLRRKGYVIRPYRVGSKFCPVDIDFTERTSMERRMLKWDKYKWKNPKFTTRK